MMMHCEAEPSWKTKNWLGERLHVGGMKDVPTPCEGRLHEGCFNKSIARESQVELLGQIFLKLMKECLWKSAGAHSSGGPLPRSFR